MALENTTPERIEELVRKQRAFFATGTTRDIEWRRHQLREFRNGLQRWEKPLCDALWKDLHKSYEEAYMTEIGLVYGEIREATGKVGRWARKRWKPTSMAVLPSSSYIVREPLGSTLILSPWNYPVQLLLNPLVGAIAAGCTAILKPSPYVPNVSKVLEDMIADIFEEDFVAVVQGNRAVNSELFKHRYDHHLDHNSSSRDRHSGAGVHCEQIRRQKSRKEPYGYKLITIQQTPVRIGQGFSFAVNLINGSFLFKALLIKGGIERIKVLAVQLIGQQAQILAEALIMHDLSCAQEADRIDHIGIVAIPQDIIISRARLLLGG